MIIIQLNEERETTEERDSFSLMSNSFDSTDFIKTRKLRAVAAVKASSATPE